MAHVKALCIKTVFTTVVLLSLLVVFDSLTFGQILFVSLALVLISYGISDVFLLPVFGGPIATVVDFATCFTVVWLLTGVFVGQTPTLVMASVGIAYILTICETLFHKYMKDRVLPKKLATIIPFPRMNLQTEISEEFFQDHDKKE